MKSKLFGGTASNRRGRGAVCRLCAKSFGGVHLGPVPKWRQTGLILGYSVLKRGGKKLRRVFYVEEYDGIANAGRPVCEGVDPLFIVPGTFGAKTPRSYKPMRPATQRNLYKIFQARRDQEEARRANSRKKYNS